MSRRIQALAEPRSFDLGWSLIERFSSLIRESGSTDERVAAEWIVARLDELDIPHQVFEPDLYLSVPRSASVEVGGQRLFAKPPSFAASTGPGGLRGTALHVPTTPVDDPDDLFKSTGPDAPESVAGKIVVTEGYPMPVPVAKYEALGAIGQIYINPGKNVHWGICTTIWGMPGERDLARKPTTPVVAINRESGDALLEVMAGGDDQVVVHSDLDEGWFKCLLPVAHIEGQDSDFVLVHGHYDSWDVGIGDNAVGNATLLELAQAFHEVRGELGRSLKVAWWPGHSTGRYAGSTWYADDQALELRKRCVAAINIDSPGCWEATAYEELPYMSEAAALCEGAVREVAGVEAIRQRPHRAGDYSFDQVGLTSLFMLLSNIPKARRAELGFYPVGGCGGNIAWHTEDDVLEVADRENLRRDLALYIRCIESLLQDPVLPLDFRDTVVELRGALYAYGADAGDDLDLGPCLAELDHLARGLDAFYASAEQHPDTANGVIKELSRILVPLGYAEGERFDHDPAAPRAVIPKLSRVSELAAAAVEDPDRHRFLSVELIRQRNKVANALHEAATAVERVLPGTDG